MSWISKTFCGKENKKVKQISARNTVLMDKVEALQIKLDASNILGKSILKPNVYSFVENPVMYTFPTKITYKEVDNILDASVMFTSDIYYYGINVEDVREIIDRNPQISDAKYLKNDYDCDNFASAMLGLFNQPTLGRFAFGYAVSKIHAFNFFIDTNKHMWIVEPQNGKIIAHKDAVKQDKYKIIKYFI